MLYGVGVNNANYKVTKTEKIDGKNKVIWECPFYAVWRGMLKRGCSEVYKQKHPTYKDVTCCEEWLTFSNFKSWMEQQDWEGKELDKDLLVYQNKIYSPKTCCFVTPKLNKFLTSANNSKHTYPIGVKAQITKSGLTYYAKISHESTHLGSYSTALAAHQAWQAAKMNSLLSFLNEATELETKGIMRVYNKIKNDLDNKLETKSY